MYKKVRFKSMLIMVILIVFPVGVFGFFGSWWNTSYRYRQRLTITTSSTVVPSGYVVKLTLDTTALVNAGKMKSDRKDFRIIYLNGSTWTEIDKDYVDTNAYFKLQSSIGANSSDSNYYVYYGNPNETTDPASNLSNIYISVSSIFERSSSSLDPDTFNLLSADTERYTTGRYNGTKGVIIEHNRINFCLDSYLDSQTNGSVLSGNWTGSSGAVTASTSVAKYGTNSIKMSCTGIELTATQTLSSLTGNALVVGGFTGSTYVYIPNSYTGGTPYIRLTMTGVNTGTDGIADLSKRDQWQRISTRPTVFVKVSGNQTYSSGMTVNVNSGPSAAGFPSSGKFLMNSSRFSYTGVSGNSFTGVTRDTGADDMYDGYLVLPVPDNVILSSGISSPNGVIYFDSTQVENSTYRSTYIPTTTATASRTRDKLEYPLSNVINNTTGSISFWYGPLWDSLSSADNIYSLFSIYINSNNRLRMVTENNLINLTIGNNAGATNAPTGITNITSAGVYHHIVMTWTTAVTNAITVYVDGTKNVIDKKIDQMQLGPVFGIGVDQSGNYSAACGIFSDFSAFDRALTDAEVSALYTRTNSPHATNNATFFAPLNNSLTAYTRIIVSPEPTISAGTEDLYSVNTKIFDKNTAGEVTAPDDLLTKIVIPAGTVEKETTFKIDTLTLIPEGSRGSKKPIVSYEFSATEVSSNKEIKTFKKSVKVIIHCTSDGNYVLGTNPLLPLSEATSKLAIGYWNGIYWMPLSNSKVTISSNNTDILIEAETTHFSKYGVIVIEVSEKKKFRAEPNPFTPAASQYNYITFSFENSNGELAQVRIWDITGSLVRIIEGYGSSLIWDGRDENAEIVEGGVYIYQVKVGQDVIGKGTIVVAK